MYQLSIKLRFIGSIFTSYLITTLQSAKYYQIIRQLQLMVVKLCVMFRENVAVLHEACTIREHWIG